MSSVTVSVVRSVPRSADAVGVAVAPSGPVPRQVGLNRAALEAHGFTGKVGSTLVVPSAERRRSSPSGSAMLRPTPKLREAAAAFTRAAGKRTHLATNLADADGVDAATVAARSVTEGMLLANYRYLGQKTDRSGVSRLENVSLVVGQSSERSATSGAKQGVVTADAANLARDLANAPANVLTARAMATRAEELAAEHGLTVQVFDRDQLATIGLRRDPRCQRRLDRAAADDQAHVLPSRRRRPTWRWWARVSCTTPAVSASSPPTR